jgi:hypothetical protein
MMSVAQSMLDYKDDVEIERPLQRPEQSIPAAMRKHKAISSKKRKACSVCQLEVTSMNPDLGLAGVKANVSICDTCGCSAHASVQIDSNRRIHQLDMFRGLSVLFRDNAYRRRIGNMADATTISPERSEGLHYITPRCTGTANVSWANGEETPNETTNRRSKYSYWRFNRSRDVLGIQ